jgi:hypothetical protein
VAVVEPESRRGDEYSPVGGVLAGDEGGCEQRQERDGELHNGNVDSGFSAFERKTATQRARNGDVEQGSLEL